MIFGKKLSDYIRFQQVILGLILVVGLARLGLSLAGLPNATTKWLSITVLSLAALFCYGLRVHPPGFGSYKQLLPLLFNQAVLGNLISITGIVIGIVSGHNNVVTAPQYSGGQDGKTWTHAGAHLLIGIPVGTLVGWLVASLVMWVTKKVAGRPAPAAA